MAIQNMCVDCGKVLKLMTSKRCYSHAAKHRWKDPEFRAKFTISAQKASKANKHRLWLEGVAYGLRCRASDDELDIKKFLDSNFAEVVHQYVPDENADIGVYDFYIADIDTLVDIDGHYKNAPQSNAKEKKEWAISHDYSFIRITEDNAKSPASLLSFLEELLKYE